MTRHRVGTREEWLNPRIELLEREKELTRRSDQLARERQELPWVPVDKQYRTELHGLSAFALEDRVVYHTYSCYDRGTDVLNSTWQLLDRTPKGRGEDPENWPRRHDEYEDAATEATVS